MSLRVWLPLNGNLNNQGLDQVTVTNNGAVVDNNGKIGKCYSFDGNDDYISLNDLNLYNIFKGGTQPFSICFWAYHADATRAIIFGDYGLSGTIQFNIELNVSHSVRFFWAGSPDTTGQIFAALNTWSHLAVVYDGTKICFYMNGELKTIYNSTLATKNKTSGLFYLGRDSRTGSTALNGKLNDFRIYDHALSPLEVKRISQGLILHYPLNRNGWGNENLLSRYVVPGQAAPTSTAAGGRTTWLGDYKITIPATQNADTYFRLFTTKQLTANAIYTISCKVDGLLSGSYYRFPLYAQSNTAMGILNLDHNGLCSLTFTMTYGTQTAVTGANGETVYICFMDDSTRAIVSGQGAITISNFKLEEGDKVTPWCPNSLDELYNTLGLNDNIQYDTSGYGNNGTKKGTFDYNSDTPKYNVSTIFNGTDNAIQTPNLTTMVTDKNYTVSCWINKATIGSKNYQTIYGGPNGFELEARSSSNASPLFRIHNWGGGTTPYEFNKWYHFCFVHSDADSKLYINGELKITGTSSTIPSGDYFIGSWKNSTSQNYDGKISDFRIYATALSAQDVLSLYNNSAYIDNQGNIYGAVYEEV